VVIIYLFIQKPILSTGLFINTFMSQKLKQSRRVGKKLIIVMPASSAERHNGWPPDRQSRKKEPKLKILFKHIK